MGRKKNDRHSDEQMINSWMKDYSKPDSSILKSRNPSFENLWTQAFRGKKIEPELVEKAMLPMKIAGLFSMVIIILSIIVIGILNSSVFSGVGKQFDNINRFGSSFLTPFIKMFNSSVFVSIPLTIVFASIVLYLVFSVFNSLSRRSYGNV